VPHRCPARDVPLNGRQAAVRARLVADAALNDRFSATQGVIGQVAGASARCNHACMVHVMSGDPHPDCLHLPRAAVRFPVEWGASDAFRPDDPATWPQVEGRLEYVNGRIRYMPPCGGVQQDVASDITGVLLAWVHAHPDFVLGSNEAGMLLGGDVRGADAAIWRRADAGQPTGFRRTPPLLAVEVAGQDEGETALREKTRWYLEAGVAVVWLVLPESREVVVLTSHGESRQGTGSTLPPHAALPDLTPAVADFFWQIDRG
jgi:Uma2 family endonuclease